MIQFYIMMVERGKMILDEVPLLWRKDVEAKLNIIKS